MITPLDLNQKVEDVDTSNTASYIPTDEEERDLKICISLLSRAKEDRKKYDKDWDKQQKYYDGEQWLSKKRPAYRASPNVNVLRPIVETIIPILTDTSPGFDFQPQDPTDYEFADIMSKVNKSWWSTSGMAITLTECLYDQEIRDIGVMKVIWNKDAKEGIGDVEVYLPDPNNIFVSANAVDFNKKCSFVTEIITDKTVGELKRMFPDKADLIKPTGKSEDHKTQAEGGEVVLVSPIDSKSTLDPAAMVDVIGRSGDNSGIEIAETWLDDWTLEDFELEENGIARTVKRRKYPRGKLITWIPEQKVILQSVPNPYKDGMNPYVKFVDTLIPRKFYGCGAIKPQLETQDMINQVVAVIMDCIKTMTNPVWIIDDDSGVDPDMITNQVGLIVIKKRGTEVRRESPPSIPSDLFNFYNTLRELNDTQSGIHDITQGRKPTGITAAEAINELQDAAQTRIRLKERNMQVSLQKLGFMVLSRFLQFYTKPRMIKITGKDNVPEYFEFYIENTDSGYVPITKKYSYNKDEKKYETDGNFSRGNESKGLFDIEVVSGTALPFMKEKRGSLARQLFEAQVIDQEELLTVLEWPRKEEIMRRMQKTQEAAPAEGM